MYFLNDLHREQVEQIKVALATVDLRASFSPLMYTSSSSPTTYLHLSRFHNYLKGVYLRYTTRGCRDTMASRVLSYTHNYIGSPVLFGHSLTIAGSNLRLDLDEAVLRINSLFHTPTAPCFNDTFFFLKKKKTTNGSVIGLFSQSNNLTYGQIMGVSALIRNYLVFLVHTALRVPKTHYWYGPVNFNSDLAVLQKIPEQFTQVPVSVLFRTITNNHAHRLPSVQQRHWLCEYLHSRTPPTTLPQMQSALSTCPKHGITYGNNLAKYEYNDLYQRQPRVPHTAYTHAYRKLYDAFLREVQRKCRNAIKNA